MKIGIIQYLTCNVEEDFKKIKEMGFDSCQLVCWNESLFTDEYADRVNAIKKSLNIEITALWCGWCKPVVWNFIDGPLTLGLVPVAYRAQRTETLIKGSDFAKKIAVRDLVTHAGFLPEDPNNENYKGVLHAIKTIALHCKQNSENFLLETGQETPTTLLRTIEDLKLDNVGINLDPANLLLYGKGNPVDAIDVFGKYIMGVHAKDGEYPTDGNNLGIEKPVGKGRVNFPVLIKRLKEIGYNGAITIENEINDENQLNSIMETKKYLEEFIGEKESI